jgi:hypothetical protein
MSQPSLVDLSREQSLTDFGRMLQARMIGADELRSWAAAFEERWPDAPNARAIAQVKRAKRQNSRYT